jgi:hypothetical protein
VAPGAAGEADRPPCYEQRMKGTVLRLESLSDDALLARLAEVVTRNRRAEAELVWHLAEVDRRKLYRREACPSMHVYATARLHLSDAEAYLRIAVARISRRFPVILSMLAAGKLHMSAIAMLGPHLRAETAEAVLTRAIHRSRREIELLIAELAPRPDVPSRMRRLPADPPPRPTVGAAAPVPDGARNREVADPAAQPALTAAAAAPSAPLAPESENRPIPPTRSTAVMTPLSSSRYGVHFTAGAELHGKITRAQALLRHQIPMATSRQCSTAR